MPTIVDFPTIVQEALTIFGDVFDTEAARRHFAEYLTGLMVAERKTVRGINREFVVTTDQSCLNRWLTEVSWDVQTLNDRRLEWLQRDPKTRYSPRGVIAIENTLVDHEGKLIEDVGWFWDHADERYVIAHDYLIANYVCPSGAHYPIAWKRCKKREACAAGECKDHTQLCIAVIDDAVARGIPGDFTFDCYFSSAKVRFMSPFGDSRKRNTRCSAYTPRRGGYVLPSRMQMSARTVQSWPVTPRCVAGVPLRTLASCPASDGTYGYAAAAAAWISAGARWSGAWAWPSRGARTKRRLRRSRRARPNIWRFNIFKRLMCPSTGPVLQGRVTPALTAA